MRLLLDTHTALWALSDPARLGSRGRTLIEDPKNQVLISAIIPWEIAIKMNSGKIPPNVFVTDFMSTLARQGFTSIEIHPLQAIRSGLLPFHHRYPFDRLLAAQSLDLGIPLISIDTIFDQYGVNRIW